MLDVLSVQYFTLFLLYVTWEAGASTHCKRKNMSTTYSKTSIDGLSAEEVQMFLDWVGFLGVRGHTFIDRLRHHHILIDKCLMGEVLSSSHCFFNWLCSQADESTHWTTKTWTTTHWLLHWMRLRGSAFAHWQEKSKTTTYWQTLVDGLNDPQFHVFIFTVCRRTCVHVICSLVFLILFMGAPGCRCLPNRLASVQGDGLSLFGSVSRGRGVGGLYGRDPHPINLRQWLVHILPEYIIIFNFVHRHLWRYTLIDRPRHHHILTLVAWCSWCWTIPCVSSFNYVNMCQSTQTNTKRNSYLRSNSCCCRDANISVMW